MGIIGFDRSPIGRKWGLIEVAGRYAGRKGLPTGLSHTYEIDTSPAPGEYSRSGWTMAATSMEQTPRGSVSDQGRLFHGR